MTRPNLKLVESFIVGYQQLTSLTIWAKFMTENTFRFFLLSFLLVVAPLAANAGGPVIDSQGDSGSVSKSAVNNDAYDHIYHYLVGGLRNGDSECMVDAFALPYLAPGQQVTGASISYYLESKNGTPTCNLQLYGLKRVSTTSSATIQADYYTGASDANNTLLAPKLVTPSTPNGAQFSYSGANLVTFIQNQYANSAFSGMDLSNMRFVFFRLNPDMQEGNFNNYYIGNARHPQRVEHPTLSLTISMGSATSRAGCSSPSICRRRRQPARASMIPAAS